jgi:peptidoglycan/LPS O-acetylase OafA/YrhL/peroxiredoxin
VSAVARPAAAGGGGSGAGGSGAGGSGPPAAAKRSPRFTELDALRGLSAVAIVVLHSYQDSRTIDSYAYANDYLVRNLIVNLDFGLGVFFALSGFVVFLPFAKAIIEGRPHMGVKEYATRRAFRIYPLYLVAIVVVWNSRYYGGPGQFRDLLRHLTFTQIYDNKEIFYTIGPAWSLAVEVHYYVFTGLLVWALTKLARRVSSRRRRIILVATVPVLAALASIGYRAWAYYIRHDGLDNFLGPKHYTVYYSALARADGFAFGMLLAVIFVAIGKWRAPTPRIPRLLTLTALVPFVIMVALRGDRPTDPPFVDLFYYSWIGIGTSLIIGAVIVSDTEWRSLRVMRSAPLQFLGIVSYSLYLWHEPLMLMLEKHHLLIFKEHATWPLCSIALVIVSVFVAWISYHVIEVPGQRLRALLRVKRPTLPAQLWRRGELSVRRGTELGRLPALHDEDGAAVDLGALARGRPLVAFLHPGEYGHTAHPRLAGCLAEARAFRDSAFVFKALGVQVVGVTTQSPSALRDLRQRERLPFPMLSDHEGRFAAAAGVPVWHDDAGRVFADRVTLIVDGRGTVQDTLASHVPSIERPALAAARSEALV